MNTRSFKKQLIRATTGGLIDFAENKVITINALTDINLKLEEGEQLGLIGHNGAGKSTLLRVLAKIYEPTHGVADINGKVTALLDVMLGMDPESTGNENIILRGILHGLTRKKITEMQDEIGEFTELGDYLKMPVRTYSSGMQLRLAFSIATSVTPEILILDEVVGAGDAQFIHKAKERINKMIKHSDIVVIASHDLEIIRSLCTKVLWLDAGRIKYYGETEAGIAQYQQHISGQMTI